MYWIAWDGRMEEGATGRLQKWLPGITKAISSLVDRIRRMCDHQSELLSAATRVRCTSPCSVTTRRVRGPWCWRMPSLRKSCSRWRRRWYTSWVHASPPPEEPLLMTVRSRYLYTFFLMVLKKKLEKCVVDFRPMHHAFCCAHVLTSYANRNLCDYVFRAKKKANLVCGSSLSSDTGQMTIEWHPGCWFSEVEVTN